MEAARKAHAHDFIVAKLDGYESRMGDTGANFSGGEKQKIALARAILRDPRILILDEFTSAIDSVSEADIHEILREFVKGRTVFLITHKLHTLEIADRIVVMDAGRIVDVGTHAELIGRCAPVSASGRSRGGTDGRVMVKAHTGLLQLPGGLESRLFSPLHHLHRSPLLPLAFVLLLFFVRLGHRELYSSHEARAAQNAQRMIDTGEWGLPVLFDGRLDLQKPPGYYWLVAVIGWINGGVVDEWATRLPSALAGLLCIGLVYSFLKNEGRPTAALIAALTLGTANHFTGIARTARIDVPLTATVLLSLLAFYRGCIPGSCRGWHLLAAFAVAMAVLLKGPVALALVGPAVVVWLIVEQPRVPLASWFLVPFIAALIALPWFFWANSATHGEFVRVFFWHHTIERYTGASPLLASHPWWYYLPRFAIDFFPWTPLLIGLAIWAARSGKWRHDPVARFALVCFLVMFGVMSTAHFKRADYLLPAYPFAAMALSCQAEAWLQTRTSGRSIRLAGWLFGGTLAAVAVGWVVMTSVVEPREEAKEEKRRFAEVIRAQAPAPNTILQFRMESHLLSYHLGRPVYTFVEWSELKELLAEPGPHFVVMPPEYVFAASQIITSRRLVEVARLADYTAARPSRPLVFLRTAD